jgi:two-component system response regulator HupR/HoxA
MVREALERNDWNKTRTADELGLSRKGLKNKIARYGLAPDAV